MPQPWAHPYPNCTPWTVTPPPTYPPSPSFVQPTAAVRQDQYGKYGIIRETDMYAKRPEFQLWAAEVGVWGGWV